MSIVRWKKIPNFDGYLVSPNGKVMRLGRWSIRSNGTRRYIKTRVINQYTTKKGYKRVNMWNEFNKEVKMYVHRLVSLAYNFITDHGRFEVDHKDRVRNNNHYGNLEWVTKEENLKRRVYKK